MNSIDLLCDLKIFTFYFRKYRRHFPRFNFTKWIFQTRHFNITEWIFQTRNFQTWESDGCSLAFDFAAFAFHFQTWESDGWYLAFAFAAFAFHFQTFLTFDFAAFAAFHCFCSYTGIGSSKGWTSQYQHTETQNTRSGFWGRNKSWRDHRCC